MARRVQGSDDKPNRTVNLGHRSTRGGPERFRPLNPDQLGAKGEAKFGELCLDARIESHSPGRDRYGWDFLLEFPFPDALPDTDLAARSQPLQCFVQLKTVWAGATSVKLRLSAAERLAKEPLPSFLCILEVEDDLSFARLHVLHVKGPLLDRVLKRLRELQAAGLSTSINKSSIHVPVPKARHGLKPTGRDLRESIAVAVGDDLAAYRAAKENHLRTSGFPSRRISGNMTLKFDTSEEYSDFLLGLRSLPVVSFEAFETRWNITLPYLPGAEPRSVRVLPKFLEADVSWRIESRGPPSTLRMRMTAVPGDPVTGEGERWLLLHPNLTLESRNGSLSLRLSGPDVVPTTYGTLRRIHSIETLLTTGGPVDFRVVIRGRLVIGAHLRDLHGMRSKEEVERVGELVEALRAILEAAGTVDMPLPLDVGSRFQHDVTALHAMLVTPGDITATVGVLVPETEAMDSLETEALYVAGFAVGDDLTVAYYATCSAHLERTGTLDRRNFTASGFAVREVRLIESSPDSHSAFRKEAESVTGLNTVMTVLGRRNESMSSTDDPSGQASFPDGG